TVTVGKENAGGHDQTITVAHDRSITVRNDQTLKVTNDRTVSVSHDEGLYVANDRKVTVEGKQEHKTTGNHISLVEGKHSLEVKGDLAQKIAGALGIKVDGDIVLESSSQISLKVGGSFVMVHSGGVDISGPKINLNGGGSPGTPVLPLSLTELKMFVLQLHFTDDEGVPYSNTRYIASFKDGAQTSGETDEDGYTEIFTTDSEQIIKVRLLHQSIDMIEGGVYE
ncbi:type VI secretion system tip protein VgrG, partial [Enterobacteriaceae bacterium G50]|nr:type VI secretion system tip protein VgrG [Enterobacteriaceae bacterium G50]